MLLQAILCGLAQSVTSAPYRDENARWNVNFERHHAPHEYKGKWDGHEYFPSPEDWRTLSIYQLITDRFADGDPRNNEAHSGGFDVRDMSFRHGGDFIGLTQKLPYIKGLGTQAIWISPVFQNGENSYHQYAQHDFTMLDQRLGTLEDLRALTTAAHDLGMYVLIDVVMNHMGNEFYFEGHEKGVAPFMMHGNEYRLDLRSPGRDLISSPAGQQPYEDFWYNNTWDAAGTYTGTIYGKFGEPVKDTGRGTFSGSDFHHNGDLVDYSNAWQIHMGKIYGAMDDLRLEARRVQDKYIAMSKALITSTDVDGFRVDTPMQVPLGFFKRWAPAIKEHAKSLGKDRFGLFGEFYVSPERYATMTGRGKDWSMYGQDSFIEGPATMKGGIVYPYYWYMFSALVFDMPKLADGLPLAFGKEAMMLDTFDPQTNRKEYSMWNFCNNHDNWRLHTMTGNAQMRLCLAVITFWPGIPLHYAGDEQDLSTPGSALDGWSREELGVSMAWRSLRTTPAGNPADGDNFDMTSASYRYVQRLNALRRAYLGAFGRERCDIVEMPDEPVDGVLIFSRGCTDDGQVAVVASFESKEARNVSFLVPWPAGTQLQDAVAEASPRELVVGAGRRVSITLPPLGILALVPAPVRKIPPALVSVSPPHGKVAKWPRQGGPLNVTLRFDRPMDASVAGAARLDGKVGSFRCTSESCDELVLMIDRGATADGIHVVEVEEGVRAQDGMVTFAAFRSTFLVASQPSVISEPGLFEQPGLICKHFTKVCHNAVGADWLRIQNVGGQWSEWRSYEEVSDWQAQPGVGVLVQYHAEGSSSYLVGDCVRPTGVRCYASWHTDMLVLSDFNHWGDVRLGGQMSLVGHFTWALNISLSEFVRGKFAPSTNWEKAYGVQLERFLQYSLPDFDPRASTFYTEPFKDGTEASRKWMVDRNLWTEHESIASGAASTTNFWLSHSCGVAPPNPPLRWQCHRLMGGEDIEWCNKVGIKGDFKYSLNDGTSEMVDCGCRCCRADVSQGHFFGPEATCCVLFNDLLLNYSISPDLSLCAPRSVREAPPRPSIGSIFRAAAMCALWITIPCAVAIWGVMTKRTQSVVRVFVSPAQVGKGAAKGSGNFGSGSFGRELTAGVDDETVLEIHPWKPKTVLFASLEYIIDHEGGTEKAMAGGLGKVTGLLCKYHPGTLICVHACMPGRDYHFASPDGQVHARVGGRLMSCDLLRYEVPRELQEATKFSDSSEEQPSLTFYLVDHPMFRERESIYPAPQTRRRTLEFYALWSQVVARLIDRVMPDIFHCPDFHAAMAVMYLERPLAIAMTLHNAEYQGAIATQHMGRKEIKCLAEVFNLPERRIRQETVVEGKFCMLKPAVDYARRYQRGYGICAVSKNYALEATQKHPVLWGLPEVRGIENCMPESERMAVGEGKEEMYFKCRLAAKAAVQKQYDLRQDPNARMFVFVGRWVKQKGVDYIADIAEWMLSTYKNAQLVMIGPIGDAYGSYAKEKMENLSRGGRFRHSLFVHAGFLDVPKELKLACDFCLMPSRDEPFGYVDIEFAWFGAAIVGSLRGGLGKLPGFYFQILNSDSPSHMQYALRKAIASAMACGADTLATMSVIARNSTFPASEWQEEIRQIYALVLQNFDWERQGSAAGPAPADAAPVLRDSAHEDQAPGNDIAGPCPEQVPEPSDAAAEPQEFLRQEATEAEMQARVEAKLATKAVPNASMLMEEVEWERELACETDRISRLLGRPIGGAPLMDWIICMSYVSGPLVSALPMARTTAQHSAAFLVVEPLIQAVALIAWTLAACVTAPHRLMAFALLSRLSYLALPLVDAHEDPSYLAAVIIGFVSPADYLFLYYSFMGSSVGDVAKLALRTGLIMAIREQWQPLLVALVQSPELVTVALTVKSMIFFVLLPAMALLKAPSLYRAFPIPALSFGWVWQLRFLLFLGVATMLEAFTHTSHSSLIMLRQARPFSLPRRTTYCLLLGVTAALPMVMLAQILKRCPSYAVVIVKAFACCSLPAVLLQTWAQVEVNENTKLSLGLDTLLFASAVMGALAVYAVAVAVLATVGSRWRFVSYTCMIGVGCNLARAASFGIVKMTAGDKEDPLFVAWLPQKLAWQLFLVALPFSSAAVFLRICAFFYFEQEATGMLQTRGHKRLVRFTRSSSRLVARSKELARSATAENSLPDASPAMDDQLPEVPEGNPAVELTLPASAPAPPGGERRAVSL